MIEIEKPWGKKTLVCSNGHYCVNILELQKESVLPMSYNLRKHETFFVLEGKIGIVKTDSTKTLRKGDSVEIPPNTVRMVTALEHSRLFQVSTP